MGITSSLSTGVWERHKDDMHVNRDLCTWLALLYNLKRLKLIKFSSSKKYDKERFVWYPSIWGLFVSIYFSGSAYLMKHPSRVWYKPYWLNTVAEKDCNLRTWSRRSSLSGMRSFTSTSPEKDHKKKSVQWNLIQKQYIEKRPLLTMTWYERSKYPLSGLQQPPICPSLVLST